MIEQINQVLYEIHSTIVSQPSSQNFDQSLYLGNAGKSLFMFLYANCQNEPTNEELNNHFEFFIEQLQESEITSSAFAAGLSGIGWTFAFLQNLDFLDDEIESFLQEIDELAINGARNYITSNNEDFMHGAIGNVIYLLERNQKEQIKSLSDDIFSLSIKGNKQLFWLKPNYLKQDNSLVVNLGLAHGQASKIGFYNEIVKKGIEIEGNTLILRNCVDTLLSFMNDNTSISTFPTMIQYNQLENIKNVTNTSRLAWCYGDLSSAYVLLEAAQTLNDSSLYNKAISIAIQTTKRKTLEETSVIDAGICHGSSGLALMYILLHRKTKIQDFQDAADFWIQDTLDKAIHEDGLAGFKVWQGQEHGGWINEYGLLEGVAGIGLVLLTYLKPEIPAWYRCLLL